MNGGRQLNASSGREYRRRRRMCLKVKLFERNGLQTRCEETV
jgi:hypothetical protein